MGIHIGAKLTVISLLSVFKCLFGFLKGTCLSSRWPFCFSSRHFTNLGKISDLPFSLLGRWQDLYPSLQLLGLEELEIRTNGGLDRKLAWCGFVWLVWLMCCGRVFRDSRRSVESCIRHWIQLLRISAFRIFLTRKLLAHNSCKITLEGIREITSNITDSKREAWTSFPVIGIEILCPYPSHS